MKTHNSKYKRFMSWLLTIVMVAALVADAGYPVRAAEVGDAENYTIEEAPMVAAEAAEEPAEEPSGDEESYDEPGEEQVQAASEESQDDGSGDEAGAVSSEQQSEAAEGAGEAGSQLPEEGAPEVPQEGAVEGMSEAAGENASESATEAATENSEEAATEAASAEEELAEDIVITFDASEGGSVSEKEMILSEDEEVRTVTATADAGYVFVDWTSHGEVVSTKAEFTPEKKTASYTANFKAEENKVKEFVITFSAGEGGKISTADIEKTDKIKLTYKEDDKAEAVTASAEDGYEFVNWTKDDEIVSEKATFTPEIADGEYTANFKKKEKNVITFTAAEGGKISTDEIESTDSIEFALSDNDEVPVVTAAADEGYEFASWTEGKTVICKTEEFAAANKSAEYTANFKKAVNYPEFDYSEEVDGTTVKIRAPEGALPEGVTVTVESAPEEVLDRVKEEADSKCVGDQEVKSVIGYDITFFDEDGNEIEPLKAILVTFSNSEFAGADVDKTVVFHADENDVDYVCARNGQNSTIGFSADTFSVYAAATLATRAATYTIKFDRNGGGSTAPASISAKSGAEVTLPNYSGKKNGYVFVGWSTDKSATDSGSGHYTVPVYPAGSKYTVTGNATLYATWAALNCDAEFYIRLDGTIPTEPQGHPVSEYTSAIKISGAIKTGEFYTNSTYPGVVDRLNKVPTDSQIKRVYPSYNPATQYVLWYVIKHEAAWHIDGVLLNKDLVNLSYNANAPAGIWSNMPDGQQYEKNTTAAVSGMVPTRKDGYTFTGWNTAADGSGTSYSPNGSIYMDTSKTLYAQWVNNAEITITADSAEKVYDGTALTKNTFTVSGNLSNGHKVEVVFDKNSTQTDAGKCVNSITSYKIIDTKTGTDVTEDYPKVTVKQGTLTVTPRPVTIKSADLTKEYDGTALVNGNTALETEEGWVNGEGATYNFTGSQTAVGESANAFSYTLKSGTNAANYEITKTEGKLTVTDRKEKYEVTLVANSNTGNIYDGTEKSATGVVTDKFTIDGVEYTVSGYTTSNPSEKNAGTYPNKITGTYKVSDASQNDVTAQFTVKTVDGTLVIGKKAVTLVSADLSKEYDGTALTNGEAAALGATVNENGLMTEEGWVKGEGATYNFTGSQTVVGESANAFGYTLKEGTDAANYEITKTEGKLTVTNRDAKYEVTLEANSNTGNTYDGTAKSAKGVKTDTFTINNVTYTVSGYTTSDPEQKDAGSYPNTITGNYKVSDASGNDVTEQFTVKTVDGTLEIGKKAVTLVSADLSKEYDGTALTNGDTALAIEQGWVKGEGAVYSFTGSQTLPGEAVNAFGYTLKEGTNAANYEITKTEGKLTVTNRGAKYEVTLEANSNVGNTYDGTAKSAKGVKTDTFTINNVTYIVSGYTTSDPSEKNAGTYSNTISGNYKVSDASGNDVTEQFTVKTADGSLEIGKKAVNLKSADLTKEYDGTALVNGDTALAIEQGWVKGEGATYNFTGSQTVVGESANAFGYTLKEGTDAANYEITKTEGKLTVTNRDAKYEVTLEANSNTGNTYDGTAKSAKGVKTDTFTINNVTYTVSGYTTSDPEQKDAGSYPNTITGNYKVSDASGNDVTEQFIVKTKDGSLEIGKKAVNLKSADLTKEYDGTALVNGDTALAIEQGWVKGEGATYNFTGSQTVVGESANAFGYTLKEGTDAANYEITKTEGKLTVTNRDAKYEVTLEANSNTGNTYDGTAKSAKGVKTDTFTINNVTYTVSGYTTSDPEQKDAGSYPNTITGNYKVSDASGNDVTEQFIVKTKDGSLEIGKKAVNLKSADLTKEYDGTALVNGDTALAIEQGWVKGEGATYNFTGSQTVVGESANAFGYTLKEGTNAANYEITKTEGKLTVTNRDAKYEVTLEANSNTGNTYDGTAKSAKGVKTDTFTINNVTYTVSGYTTSDPEQKDAGSYPNTITGNYKVSDASGNDVTEQFIVKTKDGSLEIGKKAVNLKSADLTKEYDGTALVNGDTALAIEQGWVKGEGATYNFTGSQTVVGESANAFGYTLKEGTNAANYEITKTEGKLTVTNRDAKYEVTLEANSNTGNTYDGTAKSAKGVKTDTFTINNVTYTVSGYTTSDPEQKDAGSYPNTITGNYKVSDASGNDVTEQFTVKTKDGTLVIGKKAVNLKSADLTKEYDGTALVNGDTALAIEQGWVKGEGATYNFTGSQTVVGESANAFGYTLKEGTNAANYEITKTEGKLTVTNRGAKYEVTLEANSNVGNTYDGTAKSAKGVKTDTFTINNVTYTVSGYTTSDPEQKDAGSYPNTITGNYKVSDASGNDVTEQFTVKTVDGTLEIGKKAVTLVSADLSKEYDGTALTNGDTALAIEQGWVDGEGATYSFTGSQTVVGESANAFGYTLKEGTDAANYEITKTEGKLTVTNRGAKYEVTLEANSNTGNTYDGTAKSAKGVKTDTFTINNVTYTVSGYTTSDPEQKDAGSYPNTITGNYKVSDATGNDVTEQFTVKTVDGTLEIVKRAVTLVSADLSKEYDGTALTNGDAAVLGVTVNENGLKTETGWVDGEGAVYSFTGSQTLPGEAVNAFGYTLKEGTDAANYEITKTEGKLTVTNRGAKYEVTLEANSNTGNTYDGTAKSAKGVKTDTFTINNVTYTVSGYTTSDPEQKDAGSYPNTITGNYKVSDASGNDVTEQFTVKTVDGTLEIGKKAVTLASADLSREYNGTALTNAEAAALGATVNENGLKTETGWVDGEGAEYEFTGSQTVAGESANAFGYTLKEGTIEANYEITKTEGKLTVTNRKVKYEVTLEANSNVGNIYDGTAKSAKGIKTDTFTVNNLTYTVSGYVTSDPEEKDAGTYPNKITGNHKVSDASGNDVTDQFTVKTVDGTLEIGKAELTINTESATRQYNGEPLTAGGEVIGLQNGETVDFKTTGVITDAGTVTNGYEIKFADTTIKKFFIRLLALESNEITAKASNYTITSEDVGTLEVTPATITVKTNSATKTYDGMPLRAGGSITGLVNEETVAFKVTGARTNVGTSANTYKLEWTGTAKESNYVVVDEIGKLTVKEAGGNGGDGGDDEPTPTPTPTPTPIITPPATPTTISLTAPSAPQSMPEATGTQLALSLPTVPREMKVTGSVPRTGDDSNMKLYLIELLASIAALFGFVYTKKKKKNDEA